MGTPPREMLIRRMEAGTRGIVHKGGCRMRGRLPEGCAIPVWQRSSGAEASGRDQWSAFGHEHHGCIQVRVSGFRTEHRGVKGSGRSPLGSRNFDPFSAAQMWAMRFHMPSSFYTVPRAPCRSSQTTADGRHPEGRLQGTLRGRAGDPGGEGRLLAMSLVYWDPMLFAYLLEGNQSKATSRRQPGVQPGWPKS